MKRLWIMSLVLILGLAATAQAWLTAQDGGAPSASTKTAADKNAPILQFAAKYADAFNQAKLDQLASMWAPDASYYDRESNERREGREALAKDLAAFFKENPKAKMNVKVDRVRWIKSDVAQINATVTVITADGEASTNQLMAVIVQDKNQWMITSAEEYATPLPKTSADALKDLEWMIGEWRDEAPNVKVATQVRWSRHNAFLIRAYTVDFGEGDVHEGTQIIGWDPRSQQIRSWTFDSDGSFSEETWTKSDEEWMMRSFRTLADGRYGVSTHILTPNGNDHFTVRIIGREVDGQLLPSSDPIKIVRVKAESK